MSFCCGIASTTTKKNEKGKISSITARSDQNHIYSLLLSKFSFEHVSRRAVSTSRVCRDTSFVHSQKGRRFFRRARPFLILRRVSLQDGRQPQTGHTFLFYVASDSPPPPLPKNKKQLRLRRSGLDTNRKFTLLFSFFSISAYPLRAGTALPPGGISSGGVSCNNLNPSKCLSSRPYSHTSLVLA